MYGDCRAVSDMGDADGVIIGYPLWVCEAGEGPFSLNHPWSHYLGHQNCRIQMVDNQL